MPLRILPKEKGRSFRNKRGSGGYGEDTRRENRLEELGRVDAEKAYTSRGKRNLRDEKHRIRKELKEGGSAKLTPAETRRKAGPSKLPGLGPKKSIRDRLKDWKPRQMPKFPKPESKVSPGRPGGKGKESPDKRWNKGDKFMTPLRAKKAGGGAARKGTHPKGKTESSLKQSKKHAKTKYGVKDAFKPNYIPIRKREFRSWRNKKAVGGAVRKVGKRFLDFIRTGKHVDKHGVKTNVPKAAERLTGKPHVDHGKRKRIKHLGKGKAQGGRIGLKKGSVHKPGSHSWWLLHQTKPKRSKKAQGGRIGLKHGGSAGAAIRGHGAEIK